MNEEVSLYFTSGSSDKEYHAQLQELGKGYVVNFQYGRRGATLQIGTKTHELLPYAKAKAIYDKLVAEKVAKGYTPGKSGTPFQDTPLESLQTGNIPQLLNPIDENVVEALIEDKFSGMQEKLDGKRVMVEVKGIDVIGSNRRGLRIALPVTVTTTISKWPSGTVVDGELIGDTYHVFDCLSVGERDLREAGYHQRYDHLTTLVGNGGNYIEVVPLTLTTQSKLVVFKYLRRAGKEGVVFKKLDAPYKPGRPSYGGGQLKYTFTESATVLVGSVHPTKRSVGMKLRDDDGAWHNVGNVTIPLNKCTPRVNTPVEVRYLHAYKGGSLYQPVYIDVRDDLTIDDCLMSQLKYKPEGVHEEEDDG